MRQPCFRFHDLSAANTIPSASSQINRRPEKRNEGSQRINHHKLGTKESPSFYYFFFPTIGVKYKS